MKSKTRIEAVAVKKHPDTELLDAVQRLIDAGANSVTVEIPTFSGTQYERLDRLTLSWEGKPDLRWGMGQICEVKRG